jgi:NADH-quinone oxidoreductase subunit E
MIKGTTETNISLAHLLQNFEPHTDNLIPLLQAVQRELGYISPAATREIAVYLGISENEIFGVASFYTQFRFTRPGDHVIRVCQGTACHVRGGKRIKEEIIKFLGIQPGEVTPDYKYGLESVACFGSCALSPVVVIDNKVYGRVTPQKIKQLLKEIE